MIKASAGVVAAGSGRRFKSKIPKILIGLGKKPILLYSLLELAGHPQISDIVVVANVACLGQVKKIIKKYRIKKINSLVLGGERRQDSVLRGLNAVKGNARLVLIHDAVRPFIGKKEITAVIEEAAKTGAAILAVPVKATIKRVKMIGTPVPGTKDPGPRVVGVVEQTLKRDELWEAQTPQVYKKFLVVQAYARFGGDTVTDEASVVEKAGIKVSVVAGSYFNIKITTPEDLIIAEGIIKKRKA
jgi:2-C-methyl-D-erythritol 4-phosphate cytidylyltransferase